MKILQSIWDDIRRGENIDLYITVIIAIALVVLSIFGITTENLIGPITLLVLGLLAATSLGTRHFIKERLSLLSEKGSGLISGSELPQIQDRGQNSKEIIIAGITLFTAVIPNLDFFEKKMRQGCKLRFMLLDPESLAVEILSLSSKVPNQKANIEQSLRALKVLMALNETTKGHCEVRLSPVYLSIGMAGFDPDKETGYINIGIASYKSLGEVPTLILRRKSDPKWFDFFKHQFEFLWVDSKIWQPN